MHFVVLKPFSTGFAHIPMTLLCTQLKGCTCKDFMINTSKNMSFSTYINENRHSLFELHLSTGLLRHRLNLLWTIHRPENVALLPNCVGMWLLEPQNTVRSLALVTRSDSGAAGKSAVKPILLPVYWETFDYQYWITDTEKCVDILSISLYVNIFK